MALAVLALLGGGWLLLRNSSLVAVERVQVTGVQGVDAGPIDTALRGAARGMSTLNFNVGALRAAVAPFPVVRDLSVSTSFPHSLRIHVVEQLPVAVVSVGGAHTAVAADGVVLGPDLLASERVPLPALTLAAGSPAPLGGHVEDATARSELGVLGAAPRVLLGWVSKVFMGPEGLTVAMRNGVSLYFGDATRPHAKWLSAARVLADPSSAGATYVDVRAPERPAAGTTATGGLAGDAANGQSSTSTTDATSAALANVLAEAISGGTGTASKTGTAVGTGSGAAPTAPASSTAQPGTAQPGTTEPSAAAASPTNPSAAAGSSESSAGEPSPSTSG